MMKKDRAFFLAGRLAAAALAAVLCLSLLWPQNGALTAMLCGSPLAHAEGMSVYSSVRTAQ